MINGNWQDSSGSSYIGYSIYQGTGTVFDPFKYPVLEVDVHSQMHIEPQIELITFKCAYCQHQMTIIDRKVPENCPGCGARVFSIVRENP